MWVYKKLRKEDQRSVCRPGPIFLKNVPNIVKQANLPAETKVIDRNFHQLSPVRLQTTKNKRSRKRGTGSIIDNMCEVPGP